MIIQVCARIVSNRILNVVITHHYARTDPKRILIFVVWMTGD